MSHVDDLLARLVSGELSDSQRRDLEQHLAACPRCCDLVHRTEHVWSRLDAVDVPVPDTDLRPRLRASLTRRESPAARLTFRLAVAVVGLLAAVLGARLEGERVDQAVAAELAGSLLWEDGALTLDALLIAQPGDSVTTEVSP